MVWKKERGLNDRDIITKITNELYKVAKDNNKAIPEETIMETISDYDNDILKIVESKLRKKKIKIIK